MNIKVHYQEKYEKKISKRISDRRVVFKSLSTYPQILFASIDTNEHPVLYMAANPRFCFYREDLSKIKLIFSFNFLRNPALSISCRYSVPELNESNNHVLDSSGCLKRNTHFYKFIKSASRSKWIDLSFETDSMKRGEFNYFTICHRTGFFTKKRFKKLLAIIDKQTQQNLK